MATQIEREAAAATMPWTGHLAELRRRMLRSAVVLAATSGLGWRLAPQLLAYLSKPVERLVFVAPAEAFMAHLQIALACGALFAFPYILVEAWLFVRPGLLAQERRVARLLGPLMLLLLACGLAVGYFLVFPLLVRTLFDLTTGPVAPAIAVGRYLGLLWATVIPCGLAAELPLILIVLTARGVLDASWLRSQPALALLLCFITGGMLTPQGVAAQTLLALPLFILFELGLALGLLATRRRGDGD